MEGMTAIERLEKLLNESEAREEELREQLESSKNEIRGSKWGWATGRTIADDETLPVPRLELRYEKNDGEWRNYFVHYLLVLRHLCGHIYAVPLGSTKIGGYGGPTPPTDLPYRDGAHAAHDSAHLGVPVYRITPGRAPEIVDMKDYARQMETGRAHRRDAGGAL